MKCIENITQIHWRLSVFLLFGFQKQSNQTNSVCTYIQAICSLSQKERGLSSIFAAGQVKTVTYIKQAELTDFQQTSQLTQLFDRQMQTIAEENWGKPRGALSLAGHDGRSVQHAANAETNKKGTGALQIQHPGPG